MWHNSAKLFGLPGVFVLWLMMLANWPLAAHAVQRQLEPDPQRGYQLLVGKAYLPPDFDTEVFDQLWKVWEKPWREKAAAATPQQRRRLAFSYYGLTPRPATPGDSKTLSDLPLQYVVSKDGKWSSNCFSCHGGQVAGQVMPGLPNSRYALQTLTEHVRQVKLRTGKSMATMDIGSLFFPLGSTHGTTNAVMFGVVLLGKRDAHLNYSGSQPLPKLTHHDMDAPPWWHFRKKHHIYADGMAEKDHRALMQFLLVRENGPEKFREYEDDFRHIFAYLDSLRPPAYPFPIDRGLAEAGRSVFLDSCARCHGTYGDKGRYPNKVVPLADVGTDSVRLQALTKGHRQHYADSWFAHFGKKQTVVEPAGYVAPPLDGIWASAPYFHNGSVPTLWHVLHPQQRPAIWRRSATGYDQRLVGLEAEVLRKVPALSIAAEKRRIFDTRRFGKTAVGHDYPDQLSDNQKQALLEYLKTL